MAVDDVHGGRIGLPVAGDDEDCPGHRLEHLGPPRLEEPPRRQALVDRQRRRPVRQEERVHLFPSDRSNSTANKAPTQRNPRLYDTT